MSMHVVMGIFNAGGLQKFVHCLSVWLSNVREKIGQSGDVIGRDLRCGCLSPPTMDMYGNGFNAMWVVGKDTQLYVSSNVSNANAHKKPRISETEQAIAVKLEATLVA